MARNSRAHRGLRFPLVSSHRLSWCTADVSANTWVDLRNILLGALSQGCLRSPAKPGEATKSPCRTAARLSPPGKVLKGVRLTDSRPNSPHISQLICNDTLPLESGAAPVWRSRGQPGRPLLTIYCGREGPKQVSLRSTPRERFQLCRFAQLHLKRTLWHVGRFSCWWVSWPRAFKVWWRSGGTLHFDAVCGASLELFPELSIPSPSVHILK